MEILMPTPLPNSAAMDALVEELLTKDVYIVDYLPRTVPKTAAGSILMWNTIC